MQAPKFILKTLVLCAAIAAAATFSGCGEKSPEQIKLENQRQTDISVRRARVLMFEEKSAEAIKLLEDSYQKYGASAELSEALAYAYMQNGQLASAAMFFENASEKKGGDAELQINAAKAYEQSKAFDSAINAYKKYLKIKPTDMVAWRALAECQIKEEKYPDALNSMMASVKAKGGNPNTAEAAKIGNLFVKTGNAVQGRQWLEAAYKATLPENVETRRDILLGLVTVYLAQRETALLEAAVAELDKIEPQIIDKKYPKLHAQLKEFRESLAAAQEAMKAKEKAEAEKREAEQKAKLEAEQKAREQEKLEAENKAKEQAREKQSERQPETSAESKPEQSEDRTQQEAVEVVKSEDKPVSDAPENSALKDETQTPAALSKYDQLLEKCNNAIAEKNPMQAEKFAHLAIAENPSPEAAWRLLAKAYELTNRDEDSYMAAAEAYKRNPDDIDATLFYLRNASRVLNNEKFLNKVYRAYEKFPNNPEIWVDLARTYKLIGDRRNALFFFKHFLANTPKEHILYDEMQREYEDYAK
mgnify:FL=1